MKLSFKIISIIFFVLFLSCDRDGSTIVNPPVEETPFVNNLQGNGCSDDYSCYSIDDVYYNFSSNDAFEIDYYKFNALQLASGNHDANDPSNILTLKSFNDNYFVGIPVGSILDETNQVLVIDDEGQNYEFETQDIISLSLESETVQDSLAELTTNSNPFSVVKNITWNSNQGRYNFTTESADQYSSSFLYEYNFDKKDWVTLVDTVLNTIYGDIILVDQSQYSYRNYDLIDTLDNNNEVRSTRKVKYKVKSTYISDDDALMFKQSTDCNDNYRKDGAELKMADFEIMCTDSGGTWFEDASSACDSYCSNDGSDVSFDSMCWDLYTSDSRLTGRCYDDGENEAFCDRGNNLFDSAEYYLEENDPPNGLWGVNDNQNIEPYEDRNCNNTRDLDESVNVAEDCLGFSSTDGDLEFCDSGNKMWDDEELCYGDLCSDDYDYKNLYKRSDAPDILVVTYENQSSPVAFEEILPEGKFFDSGADGCFDVFEDGSGSCLCEFNDFNDDIPSCDDYLTGLGLMVDSDDDGYVDADLNKDGEITEIDISAADFSSYNYGECINGFSGRKEDCCLYYGCDWDDDSDTCGFSNCSLEDNSYWTELLDPNADNYSESNLSGTEYNGDYDLGEQAKTYINESLPDDDANKQIDYEEYYSNVSNYSLSYIPYVKSPDYIITKELSYNDGFETGGNQIQVILDSYEIQDVTVYDSIVESRNTVKSNTIIDQLDFDSGLDLSSIVNLESFYSSILNEYHLVKTEFTNSSGNPDYDYFIFKDSEQDIVKMVHPYYHFLPGYSYPQDIGDFSEEDFWQAVHLEPDTLLYSSGGNIVAGQSFHSMSSVYSDTANYNIRKEYTVERATASLKHDVLDPNCVLLNQNLCGNDEYYWCAWDDNSSSCYSNETASIPNCLLVDRTIETTAIGPGMSYKLRSQTYFKPGFGIVREDVSIYWDDLPWIDVPWVPVSSIQYKTPSRSMHVSNNWNLFNQTRVDLDEFESIQDFDYQPYKINNTFGLQRVEMP